MNDAIHIAIFSAQGRHLTNRKKLMVGVARAVWLLATKTLTRLQSLGEVAKSNRSLEMAQQGLSVSAIITRDSAVILKPRWTGFSGVS